MRKIKRILDLKKETINYINKCPFRVSVVTASHSTIHYHESDIELIYCLYGTAEILCNHEQVTLNKGQIFTIDYKDIHCIFSKDDNCLIVFHIDMKNVYLPQDYLEYVYLACQDITCKKRQQNALRKVKKMVLASSLMYLQDGSDHVSQYKEAADNIIKVLCREFDLFNSLHDEKISNDELHKRMHNIIKHCLQNYSNKITLSSLAKEIHINENYFSQFMRNSTYGSFSNMLGYIRSYEAQYLLLTTEYSILTISHMCGFSNDKYFYKHFKRWWNKTPQEYRYWVQNYIKNPEKMYYFENKEGLHILSDYISSFFISDAFK